MQLLIIFLIWYFAFGENSPRTGKDAEEKLGFIIVAIIIFSVLGGIVSLISAVFSIIGILLTMGIPLMIIFTIYKKLINFSGKGNGLLGEKSKRSKEKPVRKAGLVKSNKKRRKLIEKFNKKYNLCLNDKEIDRINEASYVSYQWENEVVAMSRSYDSVSEWYVGETAWLRAYLRSFSVQSISSDFELQKKICLDSFAQIFDNVDMNGYSSIDACIDGINEKYYTFFDEATFMIAYRFLEENGKRYRLPSVDVYKFESELDRLKDKYDKEADMDVVDKTRQKIPIR